MALVTLTPNGLYCSQADVYIDPWRKVDKALITHGHSDHARYGHNAYLCHNDSVEILKLRLGNINIQGTPYNQETTINGVKISYHPAGHVIGSAQIKLSNNKESWVISGDYKVRDDGFTPAFEPVICDTFVTESTFGIPAFKWEDQSEVISEINNWWSDNYKNNVVSIILAYSLGKAQRILANIDSSIGPIYTHRTITKMNQVIRHSGYHLPETQPLDLEEVMENNGLIICPSAGLSDKMLSKLKNHSLAVASGWMGLRGIRRRRSVDKGFVLSDHADWDGLNQAVEATQASQVYVTHGYSEIFSKWLNHQGTSAQPLETAFEGETIES